MKILFRPACWIFRHLWEEYGVWPDSVYWRCERCGKVDKIMPEDW